MNIKQTIQINLKHSSGYSMFMSACAIFAIIIFIYKGFDILTTDWIKTQSIGFECSNIYERIEDKKTVYAFTTTYYFRTNKATNEHPEDSSYQSRSSAEYYLNKQQKNLNSATIWYDKDNPTNALVNEKPNWSIYFWMIIIPILMIMYNSWIAHKQYEMNKA